MTTLLALALVPAWCYSAAGFVVWCALLTPWWVGR